VIPIEEKYKRMKVMFGKLLTYFNPLAKCRCYKKKCSFSKNLSPISYDDISRIRTSWTL